VTQLPSQVRVLVASTGLMPATASDLACVPIFASLDAADLERLAAWFDVQSVSPGVKLVGEGAPGYSFFVLADGTATVYADGVELTALGPGDFFGELAMLDGGRRAATVTAASAARVLVMFGTEFRQLQHEHPEIAARIENAAADRTHGAGPSATT